MESAPDSLRVRIKNMAKSAAAGIPQDVSNLSNAEIELIIHEFGKYQIELESANARLDVLYNNSPAGYTTVDDNGVIIEANTTIAKMIGVEMRKLIGDRFTKYLTHNSKKNFNKVRERVITFQSSESCIVQFSGMVGNWFQVNSAPLSLPQLERQVLCSMILDVTETKKAKDILVENETIRRILDERTTLLREVHHRVKNNLQVLMSLINLQVDQVNNEITSSALITIRDRIRSISLVHERIYESDHLSAIQMGPYCETLSRELAASYSGTGLDVSFDIDSDGTSLSADRAIPLGLILTELISNCFKHAFRANTPGQVNISIRSDNKKVYIAVEDNGKGLPRDFNIKEPEAMGMQIVTALADQLHGHIKTLSLAVGSRFELDFPVSSLAHVHKTPG